jgi:cyclopropane fatty-acyl-phospholipid synthase-like methyltransferase
MKNRNKIIFICIITLAIFISILILCKKFLKVEFYNFWQTKNTSEYYKIMFQNIKNNSSLLDIGVGPGRNLVYNKDAIIAKNISIHGIDIDHEYNKYCKKTISENKLDSIVKIELKDLFHIQTKAKYDYAIFGQSFPVIPRKIMTNMLQHALKLIKDNGRIIFIHQLDDQNKMDHLFYKIKPILKHIPFVWVDSGIATSKKDFEKWLEYNGLNYEKKIIHSDQVFDLKLNIYMYICQRKLS